MSSRENGQRKKIKKTLLKSTQTTLQPQTIKVEVAPLISQPQTIKVEIPPIPPLTVEKKAEENGAAWNVAGFVSAAITLFGAALLFILGWAYEANWYGYFGVNIAQVSVQPQDVIIQSLPGVVTIVSSLIASIVFYTFFNIIIEIFIQFIKMVFEKKPNEKVKTASTTQYEAVDWMFILIITEVILLYILTDVYIPNVSQKFANPNMLWTIYEITGYMGFLGLITLLALIVATLFLGLIILLLNLVIFIYKAVRKIFRPNEEIFVPDAGSIRKPQLIFVICLLIFLIMLTSLALSATYAINDASAGVHIGTWRLQKVSVISSEKNPFQHSINATCAKDQCVSRPFALIGQSEGFYILANWRENENSIFSYNSGLFLVPRSDDVYLIYTDH
jgi:hypothetical protein